MSSTTKIYEEKMNNCVAHLDRELTSIRAGRANTGILEKVMEDYYGSPTPIQHSSSFCVVAWLTSPRMMPHVAAVEENCTMGTNCERSVRGA